MTSASPVGAPSTAARALVLARHLFPLMALGRYVGAAA
jgi:hypothetical protein